MSSSRRNFLKMSSLVGGAAMSGLVVNHATAQSHKGPFDHLQNMMGKIEPISVNEHIFRVAKAQKLMAQNNIDAVYLESSTNLEYFTSIRWGQSERMQAVIIPQKGNVVYICPMFEEGRLRERIIMGDDVRGWQEHESPYTLVATILKDMGISTGTLAVGERTRFFLVDGIRKEAPHLNIISADPVTAECRIIKSAKELSLLQHATDITMVAYKACSKEIKLGMRGAEISGLSSLAFGKLGVKGRLGTMIGVVSSSPHGSIIEPVLEDGMIILMDGGCDVHNYTSDVSRTFVFGKHTDEQKRIWDLEKRAQAAGFAAAQIGAPMENIDIAARKVITDAGFGPAYKTPGLPHRTGHGIGMDMHEWGNAVLGNKRTLKPGMCFSIEPTVAIPGKFGVRLEDCVYMTEEGPKYFSQPSVAIDDPFGNV